MSWRVRLEPFGRDEKHDCDWADWDIPEDATAALIQEFAGRIRWRLPLKIFTPSLDDPKLYKLQQYLDDLYCMDPRQYAVYLQHS